MLAITSDILNTTAVFFHVSVNVCVTGVQFYNNCTLMHGHSLNFCYLVGVFFILVITTFLLC
jgi:hypothetical protein